MSLFVTAFLIADSVLIQQKNRAFSPATLELEVGDTVAFVNDDTITHNVFSKSEALTFDLKQQAPGQKNMVAFAKPGVVEVRCAIHPGMKLMVTVK